MDRPEKPPPDAPARDRAKPDVPAETCDICGSTALEEIRCKVICRNCRTILRTCSDL